MYSRHIYSLPYTISRTEIAGTGVSNLLNSGVTGNSGALAKYLKSSHPSLFPTISSLRLLPSQLPITPFPFSSLHTLPPFPYFQPFPSSSLPSIPMYFATPLCSLQCSVRERSLAT